jgi:hypothetical protein
VTIYHFVSDPYSLRAVIKIKFYLGPAFPAVQSDDPSFETAEHRFVKFDDIAFTISLHNAYDEFYSGVPLVDRPEAARTWENSIYALETLLGCVIDWAQDDSDQDVFKDYVECRSDYNELLAQAKKLGIVT